MGAVDRDTAGSAEDARRGAEFDTEITEAARGWPADTEEKNNSSQPPEVGLIDLTHSPPPSCKPASGMPTPASSFRKAGGSSRSNSSNQAEGASFSKPPSPPPFFDQRRRIVSYKTLQDFYELLDKIERTSYVGAVFLEAYAEKLRDDLCKACWLKRNINLDLY